MPALPQLAFVDSMSDLFDPKIPDHLVAMVPDTMLRAQRHTFFTLTKRPARMVHLLRCLRPDSLEPRLPRCDSCHRNRYSASFPTSTESHGTRCLPARRGIGLPDLSTLLRTQDST